MSFAEALVAKDCPVDHAANCHVIYNNSFTRPGGSDSLSDRHQDDPAHYLVTDGDAPKNIRLPVLSYTAHYYLTDVTEAANGSTEVIPGSHRFGQHPPSAIEGTEWEDRVHCNIRPAAS